METGKQDAFVGLHVVNLQGPTCEDVTPPGGLVMEDMMTTSAEPYDVAMVKESEVMVMGDENGVTMRDYVAVLESGLGRPTVELELRLEPAGEYPWLETFLEPMKELVRKARAQCMGTEC